MTHIELTEREKTIASFSGDMIAVMELAFPQDAGSRSLYLEEWVDGSLVGSDILVRGDGGEANMTCYLLSDIDKGKTGHGPAPHGNIGKRWDKNGKRRPADHISRWKEGRYGDDRAFMVRLQMRGEKEKQISMRMMWAMRLPPGMSWRPDDLQ